MATRSSYPVPAVGYRLVNNIWGESHNDRDFTCKESHLATPIVQSTRNLRPLSVYEAWGQVPRRHFKSLFYGPKIYSLPKDPQRTDPLGQLQRDSDSSTYSRAYHLQNFHHKGYETKVVPTNNEPLGSLGNEQYRRKQHFIKGVAPGGSMENKMIYGTDELLRQSQERQKLKQKENPLGFMYGTEAATNVGRPRPSRRPNNALLLEAKIHEDQAYKNRKLAEERDIFLEMDRREKRKQWEEKQNEKRRDLEMLRSYEPWGGRGGGAPLMGKDPDKLETRRTTSIRDMQGGPTTLFGSTQRGGGGAPMRTESGKPKTSMRGDPELRFPLYGQSADIDPTLRYKGNSGYRRDLDKDMNEKKIRKEIEHQQSLKEEESHINHNPFGRPGGGAPMRDEQGHLRSSYPLTLSKDCQELRHVEPRHPHAYNNVKEKEPNPLFQEQSFDPWGKGYGTALRDKNGRVIRPMKPDHGNADGLGFELGKPGAGAPMKDQDGHIRTKKSQTLTVANGGNFSRDFSPKGSRDLYNPFGKEGAGAPVKDSEGRVRTKIMGKVEHETRECSPNTTRNALLAKQAHLKTLQDMKEQADMKRKAEDAQLKTSSKDVASWLRTGVVGQPKFDPVTKEIIAAPKHTSDITQQKLNIKKHKNEESQFYHSELEKLARERQQQRERQKEFDKITSHEHVHTMGTLWGRPGGGAPLTHGDVINARKQKVGLAPADEIGFRFT